MPYLNKGPDASKAVFPEKEYHLTTPVKEYDLNFVLEVEDLETVEQDGVKLVPLIPSVHGVALYEVYSKPSSKDLWKHMSTNQPKSLSEFLTSTEKRVRQSSDTIHYIIFDTSSGEEVIAGVIGYYNTSLKYMSTTIGPVHILPEFRRTHVQTHATGLLLKFAFDYKGFARVVWQANMLNTASQAAAIRMGFTQEGTIRLGQALDAGKDGPLEYEGQTKVWRDEWQGSITCHDWEATVRDKVDKLMQRPVLPIGGVKP